MSTQVVIAVDVGGTGIKSALVTRDHEVVHTERHATGAERGADAVAETILAVATGLAEKARADGLVPTAAGIAVPGVIDEHAGVVRYAANLDMHDYPLRELAEAALGLPVRLGHDVRAGGLAEATLGAGRGLDHVLFMPIGTGIAAAHIVSGRVLAGAHGAAGEIGHIVVRPGGPRCSCGQIGCLEAVASASAVGRRYSALAGTTRNAREVAELAQAGDPIAAQVWAETVDALADGLLTGQALFDSELIVVGGGLAEAGEQLLAPLREALRGKLTFHREPGIVKALLGDEAGCLGAALLALTLVEVDHPTDTPKPVKKAATRARKKAAA
ncbi:glucokinase [Allocatelliglobosispora scoriae]|uniref:Glucokinase n=1 Tax=Allocatelliglobosispora scoriae TaxID=643052 RepID=A0A841BUU2_9ACTN|nr:ROK family protein [Allocatelliglobosispora scoriae]MBB5870683.1 glucokinase [Allocatelliglobosispora scoriae]